MRHYIDKPEKLKILLTCPMCLKDMYNNIKKLPDKNMNLVESKEIIVKEEIKRSKEYEITCPHCKRFSITYINQLENEERNINETEAKRIIDENIVHPIEWDMSDENLLEENDKL